MRLKGIRKFFCFFQSTEWPAWFFIQVITALFLPFRSAFFLFCSEHRPKIKSEHPGLSIGDTAKKLGEMWSEQSAKDKQPYEQKAAKLKEKYEKVCCVNFLEARLKSGGLFLNEGVRSR